MIVESLVDVFFYLIRNALDIGVFMDVPMDWLEPLTDILMYGIWIVGADTMACFATVIVGWWTTKFVLGVIVWVWELLPLT